MRKFSLYEMSVKLALVCKLSSKVKTETIIDVEWHMWTSHSFVQIFREKSHILTQFFFLLSLLQNILLSFPHNLVTVRFFVENINLFFLSLFVIEY